MWDPRNGGLEREREGLSGTQFLCKMLLHFIWSRIEFLFFDFGGKERKKMKERIVSCGGVGFQLFPPFFDSTSSKNSDVRQMEGVELGLGLGLGSESLIVVSCFSKMKKERKKERREQQTPINSEKES